MTFVLYSFMMFLAMLQDQKIYSENITNSAKDPKFDRYEQQMYHEAAKQKTRKHASTD